MYPEGIALLNEKGFLDMIKRWLHYAGIFVVLCVLCPQSSGASSGFDMVDNESVSLEVGSPNGPPGQDTNATGMPNTSAGMAIPGGEEDEPVLNRSDLSVQDMPTIISNKSSITRSIISRLAAKGEVKNIW